jgi:hypothetical protein
MKQLPIEDTIISYFDGRLSDDESAELMHRVSISPEIRTVFREHKMLREMSAAAARNVSVRPEAESALFTRLAALEREEKVVAPIFQAKPAGFAMRRMTLAAALLAVVLAGTALYYEITKPTTVIDRSVASAASVASGESASSATSSSVISAPSASNLGSAVGQSTSSGSLGTTVLNTAEHNTAANITSKLNAHRMSSQSIAAHSINNRQQNGTLAPSTSNTIAEANVDLVGERISNVSPVASDRATIFEPDQSFRPSFRSPDIAESYSRFEVGIETATGFNSPADQGSFMPFGEQRLHVGYMISPSDQVGVRITHATYQSLQDSRSGMAGVYASLDRTNTATWQLAKEAYYLHRFNFGGALVFDASAGGGVIDQGWLATIEVGAKLPISSRLLAGVSFSLSRVHSNAPTAQDLMEEETSVPVLLSGSDVHNTLNGRIQYGLSYRF